jgi:hypothetical protein
MIKKLATEVWKPLIFPGWHDLRNRYAVSSLGRLASYKKDILNDGKLLKGSLIGGYRTLNLHCPGHKGILYLHREIAKTFLKKPPHNYLYVIHRNHNKLDNTIKNLRWTSFEQMMKHQEGSPAKLAYREKQESRPMGLKLSAAQVKKIKLILTDQYRNITIKQLASNNGVSEMTIYRIKKGENWARI